MKGFIEKSLLVGITATLGFIPRVVQAETNANLGGTTNATLGFDPGIPQVVNPDKPDTPLTVDANGNGVTQSNQGAGLALVYVTKKLAFMRGTINPFKDYQGGLISSSSNQIIGDKSDDNHGLVLEVGDLRGTLEGWHLVVKGSALKLMNTGSQEDASVTNSSQASVKGANITFGNPQVISSDNYVNSKGPRASNGAEFNPENAALQLDNGGSAVVLLNAEENTGYGMTVAKISNENVKLNIAKSQLNAVQSQNSYQSNLTWTLTNGPAK